MRKILFACTIGLIFMSIGFAALQKPNWDAPPEIKQMKNPVAPTAASMKEARSIFDEKCSNCHGDAGKGDGSDAMMYDPPPADLTDAKLLDKFTDGDLYYKITVGKKPMPSFEKRLTEQQRWEMVLLVRSFADTSGTKKLDGANGTRSSPAPSPQH